MQTTQERIADSHALTVNGRTNLGDNFPLGEGWVRLNLRINITLTVGSASGPIAEGELKLIKNIQMKTDRGEILCDAPGRMMYKLAVIRSGSVPRKDAIAAASATYQVNIPVWFSDNRMLRPEDTILDTARYNNLDLSVTLGTVADLFTTVGSSSITATLDVEVLRSLGQLTDNRRPIGHVEYGFMTPVDASAITEIKCKRASDLAYKRFISHESSSGSAGVPFGGTNADDVKDVIDLKDSDRFYIQQRVHEMVQEDNKDFYSLEAILAAIEVFDFVQDGSYNSALYSGDMSLLNFQWTNKTVASGDIVTLGYEAVRSLK